MTASPPNTIILIGMPGAGKTTVGQRLAERSNRTFVDTDWLIEKQTGRTLQDIVDSDGYMHLRQIEEQVLLDLNCQQATVISTGGSAVYSDTAMQHLRTIGHVCFLQLPLVSIEQRIHNFSSRGLAKADGQSLASLYEERHTLYRLYADQEIMCKDLTADQVCDLLEQAG